MKTQIITLESHDDLISVRDKLSWAKTPRILLVWPKYENVTLRLLDLKVLQRHADSLGARLGLVTRRSNVRRDAEALGIPVFASTSAAQRELWPYTPPKSRNIPKRPRRDLRKVRDVVYPKEAAWRTSLAGRLVTFTVGVLAVLAVAGLFVPRAVVTLYPESQVQEVVIPVSAGRSISSVSLTGSIPAHTTSVVVSAEQFSAVSSQVAVPKSKAKGLVRFTNLSQSEVTIPAGTVVIATSEDAVRFITLQETRLPAGPGKSVDARIEAVVPGAQANVDAGAISVLEGQLGLSLSVTNPEAMTGGADSKETGATDADRARLRNLVLGNLRREAESRMRAALAGGDLLLMDTFEIVKVLDETYSPPEGQPGKQLTLHMQAEFSANYVSVDDLNQLTRASMDASVPVDFAALALPEFEAVNDPVTDSDGVTHFDLNARRNLLHQIDIRQVFVLTRGLRHENARDRLAGRFSLRKEPEIEYAPSWWPWMPLIPFNVSVEVK